MTAKQLYFQSKMTAYPQTNTLSVSQKIIKKSRGNARSEIILIKYLTNNYRSYVETFEVFSVPFNET